VTGNDAAPPRARAPAQYRNVELASSRSTPHAELPHLTPGLHGGGTNRTNRDFAGALHLEVTEEEALEALEVAGTRVDCSLDAPLNEAEDVSLADLVAAPAAHEEREDLLVLPALLAKLPAVERQVVLLRFLRTLVSMRSPPGSAARRCTCRGCCARPSPACASNSCRAHRPAERPRARPRTGHPSVRHHQDTPLGTTSKPGTCRRRR
jgi:hypothetical protein